MSAAPSFTICAQNKSLMRRPSLSPLWGFDRGFSRGLEGRLAGVDEAGVGPLAGPVVAAAVIFYRDRFVEGLNDSKKISPKKREELFWPIVRNALFGIGVVDEREIDSINIYQASRLAMRRAVLNLPHTPAFILVDGRIKIDLPLAQKAIVKGDSQSASIAAASILAKVYRDAWMRHLDQLYPQYYFYKHKGYGTALHMESLKRLGPSPVHRRSFAPVAVLCGAGT